VDETLSGRFQRASLGSRMLTAAVGIPLVLVCLWAGGSWWIGLTAVVAGLGAREFGQLHDLQPARSTAMFLLLTAGLLFLLTGHGPLYTAALTAWAVVIADAAARHLFRRGIDPAASALGPVPAWAFGAVYLAAPLALLARWRLLLAPWSILAFLLAIWANDIVAYFVGIAAGRHKIAPRLSPGKSWEGAVAGVAVGALSASLTAAWLGISPARAAVFGVFVTIASQVGDLLESAMKRRAGVKDSGVLLPGHGGILDRFDGILVAAPIAYLLVRLWTTSP